MAGVDVGPQPPGKFKDLVVNGVRQNSFTHDYNRGWTGNNGVSKNNAYRIGRITAPADPASTGGGAINRFFFHYNPQSVTIGTSSDPSVRPTDAMAAPKVFSDVTATENMAFDFLLNRIPDVALQQPFANDSAKTYGTLHDIYYLIGLINRNFDDATNKDFDFPNTDTGLLMPYPIVVIFGELFRFTGQVTSLNIQHAKFVASPLSTPTSAPLVPVLTTVSMTLKRVVDFSLGDASGGVNAIGGIGPLPTGSPPHGASTNDTNNNIGSITNAPPTYVNPIPRNPGSPIVSSGGSGASTFN